MLSWDWVTQSNRKSDLQSILDEARKHSKNCPYCGNNEFLVESLSRGQTYRARHTFICSTCGVEHNMTAKRILTKMKRSKRIQNHLVNQGKCLSFNKPCFVEGGMNWLFVFQRARNELALQLI